MSRGIKQIAISEAGAENGYSRHILALADDGTLWEYDSHNDDGWKRTPPLPSPSLPVAERPMVIDREALNQELLGI